MSCSDLFPPSGLLLLLVGLACLASAGVGAATAYMFGQSKVVRLEAQVAALLRVVDVRHLWITVRDGG